MKGEKRKYSNRKWLNTDKAETAFVSTSVSEHHWPKETDGDRVDLWASMRIADCCRQIELDFDCRNTKVAKQRLKKVDTLMAELEMIRYHIENYIQERGD